MEHIVQLAQISATSGIEYLTRDEVRNMLAKYAGFELQEQAEEKEIPAEKLKEMRFFRDKGGRIKVIPESDEDRQQYAAKLAEGWDENENNIRRRVQEPDRFQPYSFRTIWLSEPEGIRAVVGRLKGEDKLTIQSIIFSKKKDWTLEKARTWIKDHPDLQVSESNGSTLEEAVGTGVRRAENTLADKLDKIVASARDKSITREQALKDAEHEIDESLGKVVAIARAKAAKKANAEIPAISPEQEKRYAKLRADQLEDFTKILDDALKGE